MFVSTIRLRRARGRAPLPRTLLILTLFVSPFTGANSTGAAGASELDVLRAELATLRQDYETRIARLEARLAAAESSGPAAATTLSSEPVDAVASSGALPPSRAAAGANAFNPAIGVIFQGQAWHSELDAEERSIPGFPLGGEAGSPPDGLALGETEIGISANVDDWFAARLTLPIAIEDGETHVELEEAWIETLSLPAGTSARFGRFFSGIGYLNSRHSHTWDFLDQPLAYQAFLGSQYLDDGVQLRWLAPIDLYLEFGGELLRGDRYPAAGAANSGVGAHSLFARLGGDVGVGSSWQAGVSYLHSDSSNRESGDSDALLLFSGNTDLLIAELVWKWAPAGNWRERNLILQSEFLWRNEDGRYLLPDGGNPDFDQSQFGWYGQVVYQPVTGWRVGARIDLLSADNPGVLFAGTALEPDDDDPMRYTLMLDWSHSEFSRLRLQYARDESAQHSDNQWGLQYIHSIGAHGAHSF